MAAGVRRRLHGPLRESARGAADPRGGLGARLGLDELGLEPSRIAAGLRWGGIAFGLIASAVTLAAVLSPGSFDDDQADVDLGGLAGRTLFVIPVGTVALEELAFRGVLLGLLLRLTTAGWAVVASSVCFGLWHIPGVDGAVGLAGTVLATTAAGGLFAWLRLRAGSLLAPALAHLAFNSVAFTAAWLVHRT